MMMVLHGDLLCPISLCLSKKSYRCPGGLVASALDQIQTLMLCLLSFSPDCIMSRHCIMSYDPRRVDFQRAHSHNWIMSSCVPSLSRLLSENVLEQVFIILMVLYWWFTCAFICWACSKLMKPIQRPSCCLDFLIIWLVQNVIFNCRVRMQGVRLFTLHYPYVSTSSDKSFQMPLFIVTMPQDFLVLLF